MNTLEHPFPILHLLLVSDDNAMCRAISGALDEAQRCGLFDPCSLIVEDGSEHVLYDLDQTLDCILVDQAYLRGMTVDSGYGCPTLFPDCERDIPVILLTDGETVADLGNLRLGRLKISRCWCKDGSSGKSLIRVLREALLPQAQSAANHCEAGNAVGGMTLEDGFKTVLARAERMRGGFAVILMRMPARTMLDANQVTGLLGDLGKMARQSDFVACSSNQDFVALVAVSNVVGAQRITSKMLEVMSLHAVARRDQDLSPVAGVALFPYHGRTYAELLNVATLSVLSALQEGQRCVVAAVSEPDLKFVADRLPNWLKVDSLRSRYVLSFQPQINLRTGEIDSVKADVPWTFARNGLRPNAKFAARETVGMKLVRLSLQIVEQALVQCRAWLDQGLEFPVSISLPAAVLEQDGVGFWVFSKLEEVGLEPCRLWIEIRDDDLLALSPAVQANLCSLRAKGVRLTLDDFGQGKGSLLGLCRLSFHALKLDSRFALGNAGNDMLVQIVRMITRLGRETGCMVVAKGIETSADCYALLQAGCEHGLGDGLASPMTADTLTAWAAMRRRCRWAEYEPECLMDIHSGSVLASSQDASIAP